jgi:acyl-CoA thioester hydrolase
VLLEQHTGFVVRHMDIDFKQGATLDEALIVNTWIKEQKKASLIFCQEMVNDNGRVLCSATVKVACVNTQKMKPMAIPSYLVTELTTSVS